VLGADDGQFLSQGRSPGCVAKLLYDPVRDVIVVSLANNYAVPADWTTTIADLATGVLPASSWPEIRQVSGPLAANDPRLGLYRSSRGNGQLIIERNSHGEMVLVEPAENTAPTALIPLDDGSFLQPLYYQRCQQQEADRSVTCRILSGNPRYTAEWTPILNAPN